MSTKRQPAQGRRSRRGGMWRVKQSEAATRGMREALAALYGEGPSIDGESTLAQQEQWRREDQAKAQAQGCLPLRQQGT